MVVKLGHTSREERKMRIFETRVLKRIFGPKRDEVTGEWRRLHNRELYACIPHQIKKTEMGRACSTYGVEKNFIQCFGGET
jgi:hypothetical protein